MMQKSLLFIAGLFLFPVLLAVRPAEAQSHKVVIAYTSISPSYSPAWIAKEMKIFDKNGINADVVYARGGVVATQALIGGDVSFIADNGGAAIEATLAGADLVIVASPSIGSVTILTARKDIVSPADLKGKKVAVGSLAGPALLTLKIILKSVSLNSEDVNYIVTGPTASRYTA